MSRSMYAKAYLFSLLKKVNYSMTTTAHTIFNYISQMRYYTTNFERTTHPCLLLLHEAM